MSRNLVLAGDCPVPKGILVFIRDLRSGKIFPICPDCGFAWPEHPKRPMLITDYLPIGFACPDGVAIATLKEVEGAGFRDLISETMSESDFAWDLDVFSSQGDAA